MSEHFVLCENGNVYFKPQLYYYNFCNLCKVYHEDLKRCSSCRVVVYCSKEHQKLDWKWHKDICKAIMVSKMCFNEDCGVLSFKNFRLLQEIWRISWRDILNRELNRCENQMWMFPRVCAICYSKNVLFDCKNCLNVSYCSREHKVQHDQQHKKYCASLSLAMEFDTNFSVTNKYINICDCVFQNDIKCLPKNLDELMKNFDNKYLESSNIQKAYRADSVAPAATILYGLEKAGLLENRICKKSELTVHIVGADETEFNHFLWHVVSELPFHWIQNLNALDYHIIGPEIGYSNYVDKFNAQLCQSCKSRNVHTSCTFHTKLYHDIVYTLNSPDIVVVFNNGIHEFHGTNSDLWQSSIDLLINIPGVPLVLTAYTLNEILKDVDIVRKNNSVRVISEPHRNPFSNMKPIRDYDTEGIPVFNENGYVAILTRCSV